MINSVIIINLDYENTPLGRCQHLWGLVEARMEQAGFVKHHRFFATRQDPETAFRQACSVMDGILEEFYAHGECVAHCIKEFYGIPYSQVVNLATPSVDGIKVDAMATETFNQFFSGFSSTGRPG